MDGIRPGATRILPAFMFPREAHIPNADDAPRWAD